MNIVFFNQYHNGDCFVGKGWVRNIMQQIPEAKFYYAHKNWPTIVKDLGCEHLHVDELGAVNNMTRLANDAEGHLYLNTWCGAFQGEVFGFGEHSNYIRQHRIYELYCGMLTKQLGRPITQSTNPHDYLPFQDFGVHDLTLADAFIASIGDRRLVLMCNGTAMSGQSEMGDMSRVIDALAKEFPDTVFVATNKSRNHGHENVRYTQDIFNMESDINQIAYLSRRASLIVGKNSGPFSYCQFKENLEDASKTFWNFSSRLTDCLTAGLEFPSINKFSPQTHDPIVVGMLSRHLRATEPRYKTGMQHITV